MIIVLFLFFFLQGCMALHMSELYVGISIPTAYLSLSSSSTIFFPVFSLEKSQLPDNLYTFQVSLGFTVGFMTLDLILLYLILQISFLLL